MSRGSESISGQVVDKNNTPVSRASVSITSGPQPHNDLAALTNDEGRFRLSNLVPGTYALAAYSAGHPPGRVQVVVAPGEPAVVEIRLHD